MVVVRIAPLLASALLLCVAKKAEFAVGVVQAAFGA
jgi:hypothetical protein